MQKIFQKTFLQKVTRMAAIKLNGSNTFSMFFLKKTAKICHKCLQFWYAVCAVLIASSNNSKLQRV